MSQLLRRSPRLLKRLLVQSTGSTPKAPCKLAKRKLSLSDTANDKLEGVDQGSKRTKTDFTSLAYEAVSSDSSLSEVLNMTNCHCNSTGEDIVLVTTKDVFCHDPGRYMCRLKLVLTSSGHYYIEVYILQILFGSIMFT